MPGLDLTVVAKRVPTSAHRDFRFDCAVIWIVEYAKEYGLEWSYEKATAWLQMNEDAIEEAVLKVSIPRVTTAFEHEIAQRRTAVVHRSGPPQEADVTGG
jgi:hypothetical protein